MAHSPSDSQHTALDLDLSDPGPLPNESIRDAVRLMQSGRLHRYGEFAETEPHAALFEKEFADYVGAKYAVGVNSGGCALFIALKITGVKSGTPVLVNAFNLAPVPGAIEHAGGTAILVEIDANYCISLEDLKSKVQQSGARHLLLTHMRGHIVDMGEIQQICTELDLILIEDCAHTMGAKWQHTFTGRFGVVACFSTQTFKHINSGEGGIVTTDDEDMAAKAILYSGSYMLYGQHQSAPTSDVFDKWKKNIPNFSMRMSNLVACILRPQLREMQQRGELWNSLYKNLEEGLNGIDDISVCRRATDEKYVASSIQFNVALLEDHHLQVFVDRCTARGVAIKWFGRSEPAGYTSQYQHWQYIEEQALWNTTEILRTTCDMRIPLSLTAKNWEMIVRIIKEELEGVLSKSSQKT